MLRKVIRTTVRDGYDLWARTYDSTPNPIVAMDARYTFDLLSPRPDECILDAGCGTGRNLIRMLQAGARATGLDFSVGMLKAARRRLPMTPLVQGDLQAQFPFRPRVFDAVLCALVGEHLNLLPVAFREFRSALRPGGRLIFSAYHPDLAHAGKEANFTESGTEYRLGAIRWTVNDYLDALVRAGFSQVRCREWIGDAELAAAVPSASSLLGCKVLLTIEASYGSAPKS